jgi:CheY-like chemotaxis protein
VASIILVEDDAQVREALRLLLEADGHRVVGARDGEEGLRAVRALGCDLVVCDVFMPNKDGLETIRELRAEWPHLPVVAISAGGHRPQHDVLALAVALGVDGALAKPFAAQALYDAVRRALEAGACRERSGG